MASLGLRAATTYADNGFTREPWGGQSHRQGGTIIDYIFTSQHLATYHDTTTTPTPTTNSDHKPIGLTVLAKLGHRKDRRMMFEDERASSPDWNKTLPTEWAPTNYMAFRGKLARLTLTSLHEVAPQIIDTAKTCSTVTLDRNKEKARMREFIRTSRDPIVKKAYQIRLRQYCREQRENQERQDLLAWCRGDNWNFNKHPSRKAVTQLPTSLNNEDDRGRWGQKMEEYLEALYDADATEEQEIHERLWQVQKCSHEKRQGHTEL